MRVIGIGDNVCDKYVHLKTMFPGGQTVNFTAYAKMLGADAAYMGVFGSDKVAGYIISVLDELGIDHSRCRQYEGENGYAKVTLEDGDRVFLGSNKGGIVRLHPLELDEEDIAYIRTFSHIHTSNNSYTDGILPRLHQEGFSISYDFSGQWKDPEKVNAVAPYITYAFLSAGSVSEEEAQDICRMMHGKGIPYVVVTRGSKGAMLYDGEAFYAQPPKLVEAVDTLGAGDSFATAFLLSFVESLGKHGDQMKADKAFYEAKVREALEGAAEFSAKTCLVRGAFGHGTPFDPDEPNTPMFIEFKHTS